MQRLSSLAAHALQSNSFTRSLPQALEVGTVSTYGWYFFDAWNRLDLATYLLQVGSQRNSYLEKLPDYEDIYSAC